MAHKKGQGSCLNGRDSNAQHRGLKAFGGATVQPGTIIVRQCGTMFKPGRNVLMGKDYTLYAKTTGIVTYQANKRVHVDPAPAPAAAAAK